MSLPDSIAVIGLGLMGGSLAIELSAMGVHVLGYDGRAGVAAEALAAGSLEAVLDEDLGGIGEAGLVVLATPVDAAVELLGRLSRVTTPGTVITDVGSTKSRIVAAAEEAGLGELFVGSHPLAGDHRSGWSAARRGLYLNAQVYLSPTSSSSAGAIATVESLWHSLGARCSRIDPDEHDRLMAWVSHLPQVVSSAVAACLGDAGCVPSQLGPGGRDVTRLAASSPDMWTAIALTNDTALFTAVAAVRQRLEEFERALEQGDSHAIRTFFVRANDWSR